MRNYRLDILLRSADSDRDKGATALFIALCMVVLLGFAALAIDATGLGFNERRQDQSAADVAALAAVQFAVTTDLGNGCTGSNSERAICNGAHEAIEVANATLDDPTLADWSDAGSCGSPPAGYTASSVSPCVAFNSNLQRAWVRVPTITNDTHIGRAVGLNTVSTTADAIAGTEWNPPGGILPFLLPGNATNATHNCLKASSNPNFGPCEDLPLVGNFGSADFFLYGNTFLDYDSKCSGDTNGRLVANIARGVDHPLGLYVSPGPEIHEDANCPVWSAQPNTVNSQTGIGSNLEDGLVYGGSAYAPAPYPGAIQDTSPSGYTVRNAGGSKAAVRVDNQALWTYLEENDVDMDGMGTTLAGGACDKDLFATVLSPDIRPSQMDACITHAKTLPYPVFNNSLATATRFGWVPELLEADFTGNPYHIVGYRPVYLDTTFYNCNASLCDIMHTPGIADQGACPSNPPESRITCGTPGIHNMSLVAVTAWVLTQDIVPENAKTPPPGSLNQRSYNLID